MRHTHCPHSCLGIAACLALMLQSAAGRGDEPEVLGVRAVAFSPDGKYCAASTGEPEQVGAVTLWEVATRKALWTHGEKTGIPAVAFAPDGKTLAIAVYDHNAKVLDVDTGKVMVTLSHPKEVRAVAFSPKRQAPGDGVLGRCDSGLGPGPRNRKRDMPGSQGSHLHPGVLSGRQAAGVGRRR